MAEFEWPICPDCGKRHPSDEAVMDIVAGVTPIVEDDPQPLNLSIRHAFALSLALRFFHESLADEVDPMLAAGINEANEAMMAEVRRIHEGQGGSG